MNNMKIIAFATIALSLPIFTGGLHNNNYHEYCINRNCKSVAVCPNTDCDITTNHQHNNETYAGHHDNDGHTHSQGRNHSNGSHHGRRHH